jgi:hypothetical protein
MLKAVFKRIVLIPIVAPIYAEARRSFSQLSMDSFRNFGQEAMVGRINK